MRILDTNQRKNSFFLIRKTRQKALIIMSFLSICVLRFSSAEAQEYQNNDITISASPDGGAGNSVTYYGHTTDVNATPKFDGAKLSGGAIFSQSSGSLLLTAANTRFDRTDNTRQILTSQLQYRVYATGTSLANQPGYSILNLQNTSGNTFSPIVVFSSSGTNGASGNTSIDLLNQPAVLGAGNYTVDVVYVSTYSGSSGATQINDPTNTSSIGYRATFSVSAPAITPSNGVTTWISGSSTDWTLRENWSNGVPSATSDAIIPGHDNGDPYTVAPVLVASSIPYTVRTLTLLNASNPTRATMLVNGGATLTIYGNLNQPGNGLDAATTTKAGVADPNSNSTIVLAGEDQVVRGVLSASDIKIAGRGVKSAVNGVVASNTLTMAPDISDSGVLLQTATETSSGTGNDLEVTFDTSLNVFINLLSTGTLLGETNLSFVRGVLRADRPQKRNDLGGFDLEKFGNIGLDIRPNRDIVGNTTVTRVVGAALNGPTGSGAKPIKRQYIVQGDVNSATVDLVFHYLDSSNKYNEPNGIDENNFLIFRTPNGAAPYSNVYGVVDPSSNTVTRTDLSSGIYTITLGDKNNPLPVSLVAFTAVRSNANATLAWTTASELNNSGFEVQVSSDGATFRKLAFVASQNPNSNQALNYSYTDTENGKNGIRYYRLRQLDISGEEAFSPVRAVSFSGSALASTGLAAYPNPFVDKLDFNLDATAVGTGLAHVQLVDMTGRLVREQNVSVANASLSLSDLASLRSGLYMAKVTLPDGTSQTIRIQKQ
jgi:hypothetical protein